MAGLAMLAPLTLAGCVRVHQVNRTVIVPNVRSATLDQLVTTMATQFKAIDTLNASIEIQASTGGAREGQITEIPTFAGYLFLRKPGDLRVLLLLPLIRSRALDMVSDGKTFKLLVPPKNRAVTGSDTVVDVPDSEVTEPLKGRNGGLETLRPNLVRDALLIPPLEPQQIMTLTEGNRTLPSAPNSKETLEEPDYNVTILHQVHGQVYERVRIIRIGRATLRPYEQDIYDHAGHVVTRVKYDKYQKFGEIDYPQSILITRPIDEYTLKIDITKLQLNVKLDDDQFILKIPEGVPVEQMK